LNFTTKFGTKFATFAEKLYEINCKLDLLSNVDMYQFIEKGMRGGVSYIGHRYAKTYNKYMSDYDPSKPSSYIMYYDANNLYGWAMSEELPYGKFKWIGGDKVVLENYGKGKEKYISTIAITL
jgi:hypothetical protein